MREVALGLEGRECVSGLHSHHLPVVLLFQGLVTVYQGGDGRTQLQQAQQDGHQINPLAQNLWGKKPRGQIDAIANGFPGIAIGSPFSSQG